MSRDKKQTVQTAPEKAPALDLAQDGRYIGKLAGILLAITAVTALLLGVVNYITAPVIDEATAEKRLAAMRQVLVAEEYPVVATLSPEGEAYDSAAGTGTVTGLYRAMQSGQQIGFVAEVAVNGFGGAMDLVVGLNMERTVTGVAVVSHSETPNVGSKVVGDQSVLDRFIGMTGEITVGSGENGVDAVSGATTTSKAVTAAVNAAVAAASAVS